jgi:hypothetical protein
VEYIEQHEIGLNKVEPPEVAVEDIGFIDVGVDNTELPEVEVDEATT